jgi:hypothetical protein
MSNSIRPIECDPSQAWFWTARWQAGEAEATAELVRGEGRAYESAEQFLASFRDD